MARAILTRFPSLVKESLNEKDAISLWHDRLISCFKNKRSRNKENIPEIIQKRMKFGKKRNNEETAECPNPKRMCWGMKNFLPDLEEGEDELTINRYKDDLKSQARYTEKRQNKELVKRLMSKTFPHRRRLIVMELIRLPDLVESYPFLSCQEQVQV